MQQISHPLIDKLEPESLAFLHAHLTPIKAAKETLLFYQGDICDTILWLTQGEVRLFTQADGIEEITLYTLHAGEQCVVNTASLLSQTEAIASAVTLTDIEGYLIDAKSVRELAKLSDVYQSYLFSLYQLRFSSLTGLINDIKFKKLDTRIMEWLERQGNSVIETTHEHIANELGSSRVVISRILKDLEQRGSVTLHRGMIELL